jgi:hypothetical protein
MLRKQKHSRQDAIGFILDRFYDEDADIIDDMCAIFEVESSREDIQVLNEVELQVLIEKETNKLERELREVKDQLASLEKYKGLFDKVKAELN